MLRGYCGFFELLLNYELSLVLYDALPIISGGLLRK